MFLVVARAHGPGLDGLERGGGVGCGLAGRKAVEARGLDDRRVVLICDVEIDIPGNAGNAALLYYGFNCYYLHVSMCGISTDHQRALPAGNHYR